MPLNFDPRAFMAPGGIASGLDNLGSAVVTALNRRAERKYQTDAEKRAAERAAEAAKARRAQEVEDRDLGIKTKREENDLAYTRRGEEQFNENWRKETANIKEQEFKAGESEKERGSREKIAGMRATAGAARSKATGALTKLPPEEVKAAFLEAGFTADGKWMVPGVGGLQAVEGNAPPEQFKALDAAMERRRKARGVTGTYDPAAVREVVNMRDDGEGAAPAGAAPAAGEDPVVGASKRDLHATLTASIAAMAQKPGDLNKRGKNTAMLQAEIDKIKTPADVAAFYQKYPQFGGTPQPMPDPNAPVAAATAGAGAGPIPTPEELERGGFQPDGARIPMPQPPAGPPMMAGPAPMRGPQTQEQFFNQAVQAAGAPPPLTARPPAIVSPAPGMPMTNEQFFNEPRVPFVEGPQETPAFAAPSPIPLPGENLGMPGDPSAVDRGFAESQARAAAAATVAGRPVPSAIPQPQDIPPQSLAEAMQRGQAERLARESAQQMVQAQQPQGMPNPAALQLNSVEELNAYMKWLAATGQPFGTPPPPQGLPGMGMPVPPPTF